MSGLDALGDGARTAVADAASLALERWRTPAKKQWYKAPGALVTETDLAVDRLLKERLGRLDPAIGWLSEETSDSAARLECARVWIVDPIDGTAAFAAGRDEWGVSVALVEDGRPVLGLLACPAAEASFEAVRGAGATCNGRPIAPNARNSLESARLACGGGDRKRASFRDAFAGAALGRIDSLAYQLALVGSGGNDGLVLRRPCSEWDVAAADLIVHEAGGAVVDLGGRELRYNRADTRVPSVIAASPALLPTLLERLRGV